MDVVIRVHTLRRKKKFHINVLVFIHTYHGWEHSTVLSTNSLLTLNPPLFRFSTLYPPITSWVTSESLIPKVPHPSCWCYCALPVHGMTVRQGRLTEMYVGTADSTRFIRSCQAHIKWSFSLFSYQLRIRPLGNRRARHGNDKHTGTTKVF